MRYRSCYHCDRLITRLNLTGEPDDRFISAYDVQRECKHCQIFIVSRSGKIKWNTWKCLQKISQPVDTPRTEKQHISFAVFFYYSKLFKRHDPINIKIFLLRHLTIQICYITKTFYILYQSVIVICLERLWKQNLIAMQSVTPVEWRIFDTSAQRLIKKWCNIYGPINF